MFFHADKAPEGVFVDGSGSVRGVQCRAQGRSGPRAKEGGRRPSATFTEALGSSRRTPRPRCAKNIPRGGLFDYSNQ